MEEKQKQLDCGDADICVNIFTGLAKIEHNYFDIESQFQEIKSQVQFHFKKANLQFAPLQDACAVCTNLSCTIMKVGSAVRTSVDIIKNQIFNVVEVNAVLAAVNIAETSLLNFILDLGKLICITYIKVLYISLICDDLS